MKWKQQNLTLFGKVQIIKTFALSKLATPILCITNPRGNYCKINSVLFDVIWGKNDKVNCKHVVKTLEIGGLSIRI